MTNEHCIMKLKQLIDSRIRLQSELRHKGAYSKQVEDDIDALLYAVHQLRIANWIKKGYAHVLKHSGE